MSDAMQNYLADVQARLDGVLSGQREALELAAERMARVLRDRGWVYVFGTGHSHMLAEELFFRAGGSPRVRPILVDDLMLHQSASLSSDRERETGRAEALLEAYPVSANDLLIVVSNSGRNAVPIELALAARVRGAFTVALTSLAHARAHASRHHSGKRLDEVVDLVLDNGAPAGDAAVDVEGLSGRVGAVSTVLGAAILQMVHVGAMQRLAGAGNEGALETFVSSNADGGAHNAEILRKYVDQVRHL